MPWFITAICSKETLDSLAKDHPTLKQWIPSRKRTFGFYNTYNEAYEAIEENRGSMEECVYDYIIMEYIEPGIHPQVHSVQWWAWDIDKRCWKFLAEDDSPKEFFGICNWALG